MSVPHLALAIKSAVLLLLLSGGAAHAHASEQGLVLLLPTDIYTRAGAAVVALTVLALAVLPDRVSAALFRALPLPRLPVGVLPLLTSLGSAAVLIWLVRVGLTGSRDPLSNPMPLFFWTLWWIGLVSLTGLLGDLWRWINPWTGPLAMLRALGLRPVLRLPARAGHWLAVLSFLAFAGFLMADPAPADPARLAQAVGLYWLATLGAALVFGPRWLLRAEGITAALRAYAGLGLFGRARGRTGVGLWGWQYLHRPAPPLSLAVLMLVMLGSGSFDGLNETFWWLAVLGVNPLEFPGRSAVVLPNVLGLVLANLALLAVYALTIRAGLWLARAGIG